MGQFLLTAIFLLFSTICTATEWVDSPLSTSIYLKKSDLHPGENTELIIDLEMHSGYYAYEDKFSLSFPEHPSIKKGKLNISPIEKFFDTTSKKYKMGVRNKATARTIIEIPEDFSHKKGEFTLPVHLKYQACTKEFCQFPKTVKMSVDVKILSSTTKPQSDFETKLQQKGWLLTFIFVFFAGILTSFTPCIFPMIPITLSVLGSDTQKTSVNGFAKSLTYVLGIATTYSLLGLIAARTGALFGALLGNIWVVSFIALIFTLMALSMFGVFAMQAPQFVQKRLNLLERKSTGQYFRPYLIGLIAGIVASPCVGPVLVSILTYVAKTQNEVLGFWLLFTYAIGMGLIFILIGTIGQLSQKLPRSGPWLEATKFIFGFTMLAMALYYLEPVVPPIVLHIIGSFYLILSGVLGGASSKRWVQIIMRLIIIAGVVAFCLGVIQWFRPGTFPFFSQPKEVYAQPKWHPYSEENFKKALVQKTPVIVDVYADWCAACKELEKYTFSDSQVLKLGKNFLFIKLDATKDSPLIQEVRRQYQIKGLPTILFFSKSGKWLPQLTLTEFEKPEPFLQRMEKAVRHGASIDN